MKSLLIDLATLAYRSTFIKAFRYGTPSEKGGGFDTYPLLWIDDPIKIDTLGNAVQYTVNLSITGQSKNKKDIIEIQHKAFETALAIKQKINNAYNGRYSLTSATILTVRQYFDDATAGIKATFIIKSTDNINYCDEHFKETPEMPPTMDILDDFSTGNAEGCVIFEDKNDLLPNFTLK